MCPFESPPSRTILPRGDIIYHFPANFLPERFLLSVPPVERLTHLHSSFSYVSFLRLRNNSSPVRIIPYRWK